MSRWRRFKAFMAHAFSTQSSETLTPEELALLERIAKGVARRGLAIPAVLFLESMRPLNYVGSQLLVGLQPLVDFVINPTEYEALAKLLEKRTSIDTLMTLIEAHERTGSHSGDGLRKHDDQSHSDSKAGG